MIGYLISLFNARSCFKELLIACIESALAAYEDTAGLADISMALLGPEISPIPNAFSVEQVLHTIQGALSNDSSTRVAAETHIRAWESDAAPGFLVSLLRIVEQQQSIDGSIRLLAVVIAKNAVGSSWRKTLGTREWSRVPDEEKALVKEATVSLMLSEPLERLATQLALLLTNIARFDFPGRAPNMLNQLLNVAGSQDAPPTQRLRAMKALYNVLRGLSTKRFVIETPQQPVNGSAGPGLGPMADLRQLSQQINAERELFKDKLAECFQPVGRLFGAHCEAFASLAPGWDFHAPMAKAAASSLTELLMLAPTPSETLPEGAVEVLGKMHLAMMAFTHLQNNAALAGISPQQRRMWEDLAGKLCERMTRCVIAALDHYAVPFAIMVTPFLELYVENALISLDAATVRAMRAKRRVGLVRFIAKALLNPFYRPEWAASSLPLALLPPDRRQLEASRSKAMVAQDALARMLSLSGGLCAPLVEAIISKYVALSPEELEEWRDDPESYARSMDVESGPDADTPRPIGVGLLLCMLERGGDDVVMALLKLAQRMQATSPPTQESVLMREACYRCIGEGFNHISTVVNFSSWYATELSPQLMARLPEFLNGTQDLSSSVLQARALWLLGVCGSNLGGEQWCGAYQLVVQHMASKDLVVALTAVSSSLALTAAIMDDQAALDQHEAANKPKPGMPNLMTLQLQETAAQQQGDEVDEIIAETKARVELRVNSLSETMSVALGGCFAMLERLVEVESMVRVLQLVSVLVEVMGVRILPHVGILAAALPHIWATASSHLATPRSLGSGASPGSKGSGTTPYSSKTGASSEDTGAVVRLHSALIAVLTHLVGKLRAVAVRDPQIAGVIFPLLNFSTSLGSQESECLVEEAFRLWNTTICSLPEVPQQMLDLLPHLGALLTRGKDNAAVFPIIESYLLLGAAAALHPLSNAIQTSLERASNDISKAVVSSSSSQPSVPPSSANGKSVLPMASRGPQSLSPETAAEAMAAAALADVMLQLFPQDTPALLSSTFRSMASLVAHPSLPLQGVNVKALNVMEGFLEVLGRLLLTGPGLYAALLEGLPEGASARFLDRWLQIASARFLEEVMGVRTMAMLGRYRRRIAIASMSSLVAADTCPDIYEPLKLVRVVSLALQAVLDNNEFRTDQTELDSLDFKNDLAEDYVMARRLSITRNDPIRNMNIPEKVRLLLQQLALRIGGEDFLRNLVQQHASLRVCGQLASVLQGVTDFSDSGDDELLYGPGLLPSRNQLLS
ncbi:hypothetical protein CEUSTIGMA_g10035.t1 [Chlamydomonas eustigma]|uniref:Importin N-terminal domain-containing protein n=1 Tax=Chlamydomonas eustigma TaxID=1157962 RepID=A0A250XI68_9CHLO|nr:hypothetical protein CEUSTIGMA_g10035.t1 [Chlamydomonas eustigma]|eukprot:GAX82609.1 hypothetical protein CEUSTIGMA_g10035.t1 [Chlamydomonas eustigma]